LLSIKAKAFPGETKIYKGQFFCFLFIVAFTPLKKSLINRNYLYDFPVLAGSAAVWAGPGGGQERGLTSLNRIPCQSDHFPEIGHRFLFPALRIQ
jgi:hypothetical protein